MEIWATQSSVFTEVLAKSGLHSEQIAAIGITNQRETTVVLGKGHRQSPSTTPSSGSAAAPRPSVKN